LPIYLFVTRNKGAILPAYRAGWLLPAFALSEPEAGSDTGTITTRAHRDGTGFILEGQKSWTSNAGLADLYVAFARLDDGRQDSLCAFIEIQQLTIGREMLR
jgi:alkylation response protein AidB-like acyl-CoA dehydrogenase